MCCSLRLEVYRNWIIPWASHPALYAPLRRLSTRLWSRKGNDEDSEYVFNWPKSIPDVTPLKLTGLHQGLFWTIMFIFVKGQLMPYRKRCNSILCRKNSASFLADMTDNRVWSLATCGHWLHAAWVCSEWWLLSSSGCSLACVMVVAVCNLGDLLPTHKSASQLSLIGPLAGCVNREFRDCMDGGDWTSA